MPTFSYHAESFTPAWGPSLHGRHNLSCSWSEIVWGAITVGKQNWIDVWRYGNYSRLEAIFRVTMLYASLMEETNTGKVKQTLLFSNMDPSEKTAISYFHGLMCTKILANRLLGVPWLMHFDVYKNGISHHLQSGIKPDFIGVDINQNWTVLEAKGRSNGLDREAIDKGKRQTRGLRRIAGNYPNLRAVVQSYFSKGYLRSRIVDPEGDDKEAVDVNISLESAIGQYYKFLFDLLGFHHNYLTEIKIGGVTYITLELPEVDIEIGLNVRLYKLLSQRRFHFDQLIAESVMQKQVESTQTLPNQFFVGADGIAIKTGLSWSQETMRMEPNNRLK